MLVANSFDLWQKDAFFSAAEEVQHSADILESAYRAWFSAKRDGISSNDVEDLRRELQTALGTAKWQLEEFERAVRSSYGSCRDQNIKSRHQQFIVAIESQISRAEDALRESLNEEGKQPFRWVNLNEDERDDLAMFLSGFSRTPTKNTKYDNKSVSLSSESENLHKKQDLDCAPIYSEGSNSPVNGLSSSNNEILIDIGQPDCVMDSSTTENSVKRLNVNCEADRSRTAKRSQGFSKFSSMSVLTRDEDDQTPNSVREIEDSPKERGSRFVNFLHFRVVNCICQSFRRSGGLSGKMQISRRLHSGPPMRLLIILMVSFFLLVPYLLQ
ncbi:hypothetical protein RND81_11G152700 [Saponaria officinalis]|uniref:Syntaxin 6/10/61 N-terminal domain-containing protein n=1 Tax=Saponaria officinalis TaxID=3572 RepID=A0AAW1HMH6_SAPOF